MSKYALHNFIKKLHNLHTHHKTRIKIYGILKETLNYNINSIFYILKPEISTTDN